MLNSRPVAIQGILNGGIYFLLFYYSGEGNEIKETCRRAWRSIMTVDISREHRESVEDDSAYFAIITYLFAATNQRSLIPN